MLAPLYPPNFGGRPDIKVPQHWGLKALRAYKKRGPDNSKPLASNFMYEQQLPEGEGREKNYSSQRGLGLSLLFSSGYSFLNRL
jgi:hypothetical protein